ncbi:chromosome partitioning protein ParB [Spirochaetia bacterium]|nr:chromosome partitioning protein ParB [Spirochaetia bacterium]
MQVPISDIKVKRRIRKEPGDIDALAESLKRFGQISPIVLTKNNVLITGNRRLEAAKALGWHTINAVIADLPRDVAPLEIEVEENVQRRDFTSEEIVEAVRRINKLKNPNPFRRLWNAIVRFFRWLFKINN